MFNKARTTYDSDPEAEIPDAGDVLVQSLGPLSLSALRSVVSETLRTHAVLPDLFDESDIGDREAKRKSWRENTVDNIRNTLGKVGFEEFSDDSFVKFRINDSSIVVNKSHPFVMEHSRGKAQKQLMRTVAIVTLLSDVYALDIGIDPESLDKIRTFRDKLMRFQAMRHRESGKFIASLLLEKQHESSFSKRFEAVVSDALHYLGFDVLDLAGSGEPEGIARAFPTPTGRRPTVLTPRPPLYSFSFDAKSSKHSVVKTNNIRLDAVVEHRERYDADHALVIAPDFGGKAIVHRCTEQKVTPMKARDLGRLLEYTARYGAIPLAKLRDVLKLYDPSEVTQWVEALDSEMKSNRKLTIDVLLKALEKKEGLVPDALPSAMIADICREQLGVVEVIDKRR